MRFSIRTLLLVTAVVAASLGIHLGFRSSSHPNYVLWLGWYLIAVSLLTMLCFAQGARLLSAYRAATIFGWAYFICVLKGGFWIETFSQAEEFAANTRMGLAFMGLCFLIAATAMVIASPLGSKRPEQQ
jgi:hypothetical protein